MKKLFLLCAAALFTAQLGAEPASSKRDDLVTRVETCEAILQEFMYRPATAIPSAVTWTAMPGLIRSNPSRSSMTAALATAFIIAHSPMRAAATAPRANALRLPR